MRNTLLDEQRANFRMPDLSREKNLQGLLVKRPGDHFPEGIEELLEFKEAPLLKMEDVPDNHIYMKVLYTSVDPAMRMWMTGAKTYFKALHIGDIMHSFGIGQVIYSKYPAYEAGDLVYVNTGMQKYSLVNVGKAAHIFPIPPQGFGAHHYLNILGTNGSTAYYGILKIGKPKKGETCVISTAAGATGLIACQIAKISGCRVVGICGSEEKCKFLKETLGIDEAINYKSPGNLVDKLKAACPKGIDIYYDNVGEETLDAVLANMNNKGRVALAGVMSAYVDFPNRKGVSNYGAIVTKRIKLRGFLAFEAVNYFPEMVDYYKEALENGQMKSYEDVYYNLLDAPKALKKLFKGENIGKLIFDLHSPLPPKSKL